MKTSDVLAHYGNQRLTAKALGCTQAAVAQWKKAGSPPPLRQLEIENLTGGKLKASEACARYRVGIEAANDAQG
jgi:DNA-binding transcriptional regulator YdaS (Cro superfamily)